MPVETHNDISGYTIFKDVIRPGDIVMFDGWGTPRNIDCVVSDIVEIWTNTRWSHVAIVDEDKTKLLECNIRCDRSGPQLSDFIGRLLSFTGMSIWVFPMQQDVRDLMDFPKMWKFMHGKVGRDSYSERTILDFVLRIFGINKIFKHVDECSPHCEICSEFIAEGLQVGGYKLEVLRTLNPHIFTPSDITTLPIFCHHELIMKKVVQIA